MGDGGPIGRSGEARGVAGGHDAAVEVREEDVADVAAVVVVGGAFEAAGALLAVRLPDGDDGVACGEVCDGAAHALHDALSQQLQT